MGILTSLFGSRLYIQLSPALVTLRNPGTGETISEPPEAAIAYAPKQRLLDVGLAACGHASVPSVRILNPFTHPRTLVSDFTLAEQVIKAFVARMKPKAFITVPPSIVLHPLGEPAGGLTQVEIRAIHELGYGAGARQVKVWEGRTLTDDELLSGKFPTDGQVLS